MTTGEYAGFEDQVVDYYRDMVDLLVDEVIAGTKDLAEVPREYFDDVITTAFYELTDRKMTLDGYMRYITLRAFLRRRKAQAGEHTTTRQVSSDILVSCDPK